MHTERYMNLPEANRDGYFACSILNQNLENMKNKQYTIIAGTADDNVHFQNAAQISKAFIGVGAEIKAQVTYNLDTEIKKCTLFSLSFLSQIFSNSTPCLKNLNGQKSGRE